MLCSTVLACLVLVSVIFMFRFERLGSSQVTWEKIACFPDMAVVVVCFCHSDVYICAFFRKAVDLKYRREYERGVGVFCSERMIKAKWGFNILRTLQILKIQVAQRLENGIDLH